MTATDAVDETAGHDGGVLPPYSAEGAVCPKCLYTEAFTWYRQALTRRVTVSDWNGAVARRGPLPERHERECGRCTYRWDEALPVDRPGMTVDALVYALDNSTPYPVELDRTVLEHMAFKLLGVLNVTARPDHPLWQYSDGRPPPAVAPQPAQDSTTICEVPHETREEEEACERRRLAQPATPAKSTKETTR
ncbi:hypothetical protein [Streptomyces sp. NPDC018693]|uniref:hypothetical protein n=1 Tax=unclassified Streptomyces TaxID=2593676 RepID=UPI0037B3141A